MSGPDLEERLDCGVDDCPARSVIEHGHTGVRVFASEILTCSALPPGVSFDFVELQKILAKYNEGEAGPDSCRRCRIAIVSGGLACLEHLTE